MTPAAPASRTGVITVREVTQADLEVLTAHESRPELGLARQRFEEHQAGTGVFAVALIDDIPVGSGFLDFIDEELVPELKNLWVFPENRRSGAGHALWEWLEDQAREHGYQQVFLAVDPNNYRAIPLFIDLGYSPTGHHLFVENPDTHQVTDPSQVSDYYAIYQKSLLAH